MGLWAGIEAWNLANFAAHRQFVMPYAVAVAFPLMALEIYWVMHQHRGGYLSIAFGSLIHPTFGMYTLLIMLVLLMLDDRQRTLRHVAGMGMIALCAAGPPIRILLAVGGFSSPTPPRALCDGHPVENMHGTPWEAPFRWDQQWPATVAFGLLAVFCIPVWKRLGRSYYLLIISMLIAAIALSLSQLLGHAWQHPRLITLLGLRAPFLLATVLFPIIAWRLLDDLGESALIRRFLAAFIILMMFRGTPYGLDKWPFLFWGGLRLLNSYQRQERTWLPYVESGLVILLGLWLAIWFLRLIESPFLIDPGPNLKWIDRWIVLVGAWFVALAPSFHRLVSRQRQGYTIGVWLLILLFLADTTKRAVSLHHEWQHGRLQDLYNAQLWANTHTRPEDAFIVPGGAWRSFSERRTFVPRPQGYHFYHLDRRIKVFDDRIYLFFGMLDDYTQYPQDEILARISQAYDRLTENDFRRLGRLA